MYFLGIFFSPASTSLAICISEAVTPGAGAGAGCAAAPARAVAEEMPVYTHVNFVFLSNETTEMTTEGAMQSTGNVYYDDIIYLCSNTLSEEWEYLASALDEVKSGSFAYRNNVVCANGNIEVYDVNGIMVARGVDNVDLTAVAKGAYIVRCGDAAVKIMR